MRRYFLVHEADVSNPFRDSMNDLVRQSAAPDLWYGLSPEQQATHQANQKLLHLMQGAPVDLTDEDWKRMDQEAALQMLSLSGNAHLITSSPVDWTQSFARSSFGLSSNPPSITHGLSLDHEPSHVAHFLLSSLHLHALLSDPSTPRSVNKRYENVQALQSRALDVLLSSGILSADTPLLTVGMRSFTSDQACLGNLALASASIHAPQILSTAQSPLIGSPVEMIHALCRGIIKYHDQGMFLRDDDRYNQLPSSTMYQMFSDTMSAIQNHDVDVLTQLPSTFAPDGTSDGVFHVGSLMLHAISKGLSHYVGDVRSTNRRIESKKSNQPKVRITIPPYLHALSQLLLQYVEQLPSEKQLDALSIFVEEGLIDQSRHGQLGHLRLVLDLLVGHASPALSTHFWKIALQQAQTSNPLNNLLVCSNHSNMHNVGTSDDLKMLVEIFSKVFQSPVSNINANMDAVISEKMLKIFHPSVHDELTPILEKFSQDFQLCHKYISTTDREKIVLEWTAAAASFGQTKTRAPRKI